MAVFNNDTKGFKPLNLVTDVTTTVTLLHEAIPITGTILHYESSSYLGTNFVNGAPSSAPLYAMLDDYPAASSSANYLFSITAGVFSGSTIDDTAGTATTWNQQTDKRNMANHLAQVGVGYNVSREITPFNIDMIKNPADTWDPVKKGSIIEFDFSRVLVKDEIKMGSFQISIGTGSLAGQGYFYGTKTLSDAHATPTNGATFKTDAPVGNYAFLQNGTSTSAELTGSDYGVIYYQAGKLVLWGDELVWGDELTFGTGYSPSTAQTPTMAFISSSILNIVSGAIEHVDNISFNNTTKLNSRIYFCRATHNEFNYSTNPTYLSGSQIVVKNEAKDPPVSYITSVGLYSADNELLAIAKLSEPVKKTSGNELTFRVRLDF